MSYDSDLKKLKDAFALKDEIRPKLLSDVICHRTNLRLKGLQDAFSQKNKGKLLIEDLAEKIINTSVSEKDVIIYFITRVLADANRPDPAHRDTSTEAADSTKAEADAAKLLAKLDSDVFQDVFVNKECSMTFAQVRATCDAFEKAHEDKDELVDEIQATFTGIVRALFKTYIEYALED